MSKKLTFGFNENQGISLIAERVLTSLIKTVQWSYIAVERG
jgi:hypothetical protein